MYFGDGERVELGAQWIHGEENELFKLVKKSGHLHPQTSWEGEGPFLLPSGERVDDATVQEILEWIENTIGYVEDTFCIEELQNNPSKFRKPKYSSMGAFLRDRFNEYLKDSGVVEGTPEFDIKNGVFQWGMR